MADMQPVTIPQPPAEADLKEMHKHLTSLSLWMGQNFGSGVQQTWLSTNQATAISGNENIGKIHFNSDTGTFQCTEMVGGNLVLKTIQTA